MTAAAAPTQSAPDLVWDDPVAGAARWVVEGRRDPKRPMIPQMRAKFGISAKQAISALREAHELLEAKHVAQAAAALGGRG